MIISSLVIWISFRRLSLAFSSLTATLLMWSKLVPMLRFYSSSISLYRSRTSEWFCRFVSCSSKWRTFCFWSTMKSDFHFLIFSNSSLWIALACSFSFWSVSSSYLQVSSTLSCLSSVVATRWAKVDWFTIAKTMFLICCIVNILGSLNLLEFIFFR